MESWHPCQVDGGWRIRARVGGQGQHVGWEHFDGEDEEEEDYDGDKQEDDDQDDKDKNDKGEDDNGEQGCRYVVENILMGRTIRKRLRTRRMMMGDRDNIWAREDFANMWRAEFHREIDQTVLPCGDATNKSDSKKKEILLLNFRKSHCCALGNPISGVGIGSKVEGLV